MTLNELLTLYCEQQEATGYSIQTDHQRNQLGEYPVDKITISFHWTGHFQQIKPAEFIDFPNESAAIEEFKKLTQLNKAIA